jgi:membrane fusion protein (multidrug efflux system)
MKLVHGSQLVPVSKRFRNGGRQCSLNGLCAARLTGEKIGSVFHMAAEADVDVSTLNHARAWRRRVIPTAILVTALVVVVVIALMPAKLTPMPDNGVPPVNVIVQTVRPLPELADTFTLSAVVEPDSIVRVAAEVAGQIERYGSRRTPVSWRGRELPAGKPIEEGEPVARNDPIVYLNTDLLEARFERARAQFEYDQTEYDRIADLYERGVTSKTEFDEAGTTRNVSKALLDEATRNLERATIVAPISGVLNRLPMEIGEYASPGDQVAEIVNIDRVKAIVDVPERDIYFLNPGDPADIFVDALPETRPQGQITYISELADDATRTTRIEITVDNRAHLLRSGQIVRVRLTRRVLTDVIMIPLESVIPLEQGRVVYVANDGQAERRDVVLGLIEGRSVRVLSGLQAGDRLIVAGHRYVGPGQPVNVVEQDVAQPGETGPVQSQPSVADASSDSHVATTTDRP